MLTLLLPEIFDVIASHLPLHIQTSSLLALALTNHKLNEIIIPQLLYQQVWLQGEKSTLKFLSTLRSEAIGDKARGEVPLGHKIRRLCIASECSTEARESNTDVVRQLHTLIDAGVLRTLVSLFLHLGRNWYVDVDNGFQPIHGFGRFDSSFWSSLKKECPMLTEISLTGVEEWYDEPWLEESGLFEYQQLKCFRFQYRNSEGNLPGPITPSLHKLYHNLVTFSPYLHTLVLHLSCDPIDVTSENGLFTRHFPHLRRLSLYDFVVHRSEIATGFWTRHCDLEVIELSNVSGQWFHGFSEGLPRLRVLMAPFEDVRVLAPILGHRLINLTVSSSVNFQVPYLLRAVLPNGLAALRSLGIYQIASRPAHEIGLEGSRWHESEQGVIDVNKRKATSIDAAYILSLSRGVPNLEELELIGKFQPPIASISSALSTFTNLRRIYYFGESHNEHYQSFPSHVDRNFIEDARELACRCPTLEFVIALTGVWQTVHRCARIQRTVDGDLVVSEERGFGRTVGMEDSEYPGFLM